MTILRVTVRRIAVNFYDESVDELIETRKGTRWERVYSTTCDYPDHSPAIMKRHPRKSCRKDGQSYSFYAIEARFPDPRLMGKGFIDCQGDELPDR